MSVFSEESGFNGEKGRGAVESVPKEGYIPVFESGLLSNGHPSWPIGWSSTNATMPFLAQETGFFAVAFFCRSFFSQLLRDLLPQPDNIGDVFGNLQLCFKGQ